ncbi:MAG: sodium:proton antiporter, partial [Rhodothermales bacterium]|nr:sodium:proton antiporter [Rhodothermales bacterium]
MLPSPLARVLLAALVVGWAGLLAAPAVAQDVPVQGEGGIEEEVIQDEPVTDPETELGLEDPDPVAAEELAEEAEGGAHGAEGHEAVHPPLWLVIPFLTLLLMIATGPLFYLHHWHHHYPKYAVALGAIVA